MSISTERFMELSERKRINPGDEDYIGFDMSGYGEDNDTRSSKGMLETRITNYLLIKKHFPIEFGNLQFHNFNLNAWKGVMWWGKKDDRTEYSDDFAGWSSMEIIEWMLINKELWDEGINNETFEAMWNEEAYKKFIFETEMNDKKLNEEKEIEGNEYKKFYVISRVITKQQRYEVLKRQKWQCNQCCEVLKFNKNSNWEGEVAHIDHIHPFSKKETYPNGVENINESSNLQALCPRCNLTKSGKEIH